VKALQVVGNSKYGGATYLVLEWCRYLIAQGCKVDVLSTDRITGGELQRIPGVHVIDSILIPRDISLGQDLKALFQLLSLLRRERYDIVHTYTATPGFLGRIAARFVGVPAILQHQAAWTVTEDSSRFERATYTPLEFLAALASSRSICVSHAVAQQAHILHTAPQCKLVTICNGIDPQPFIEATQRATGEEIRQRLGISSKHLLIGGTGRLAPQKDNESLIRAMKHLVPLIAHVPASLILAGDGPDRQKLEDIVHSLCLSERVRFLGFSRDIPAFLAGVDIYASASLREGLSISLLEAMATATPVIATSISSNSELIEHEVTGLLVPVRSPEQIAQSIARYASDPELARRCASAARQRVLEYYTIDRMFQETWDLYIGLLSEKRTKRKAA
jgi:glycosyltransferase involved in cell wall biosynthesis